MQSVVSQGPAIRPACDAMAMRLSYTASWSNTTSASRAIAETIDTVGTCMGPMRGRIQSMQARTTFISTNGTQPLGYS